MKGLKDTLAELSGFRKNFENLVSSTTVNGPVPLRSRLVDSGAFGSNPGNLRMLTYAPSDLAGTSPLVVALHGCTQTAAAYDYGSGWSALADEFGFAVLFPEQQTANNPNRCFNWFSESDTKRDHGEAQSIREMIDWMARVHGVDRSRIFVVGLSAGGAMASAMLASYPEVFTGGAIVAGLPFGAATNVQTAFEAMAGKHHRTDRAWGALVHSASSHKGPWPKISIWHGTADAIVSPANMEHIVGQWSMVHGLNSMPDIEHNVNGHARRVWQSGGDDLIEAISVAGMGHGVPLASGSRDASWGNVSPFHIDVGLSSSRHILQFWNLADTATATEARVGASHAVPLQGIVLQPEHPGEPNHGPFAPRAPSPGAHTPSSIITAALATAGVIKSGANASPKDPRGIIAATLRSVGLLKD